MYLILVAAEESLPAGHPCHLVPMEPLGRHSDAVSMRRLLVLSLYACMLQTTKNPCKIEMTLVPKMCRIKDVQVVHEIINNPVRT